MVQILHVRIWHCKIRTPRLLLVPGPDASWLRAAGTEHSWGCCRPELCSCGGGFSWGVTAHLDFDLRSKIATSPHRGVTLRLGHLSALPVLLLGIFVLQIPWSMQRRTCAQHCFYCLIQISLPDPHKTQSDLHLLAEESAAATSQSNCFTQRNSLFHRDVLEVTFACCQQVATVIPKAVNRCPPISARSCYSPFHISTITAVGCKSFQNENTFKVSYLCM